MHRTTRAVLAFVSVSLGLSYMAQRPSQATPKLMRKEGLTSCGYCHVREQGGGARNYRGQFYDAHDKSFAGFDDAAEAKAAGVEIGPHAEMKPASLTPPAAAPAPAPVVATPAPAMATPAAVHTPAAMKSALATATEKAHAAKLASEKSPKDAKLKAEFITALAGLTHATWTDTSMPLAKRKTDTMSLAKRVLAMDPKNVSAKADMKAASAK